MTTATKAKPTPDQWLSWLLWVQGELEDRPTQIMGPHGQTVSVSYHKDPLRGGAVYAVFVGAGEFSDSPTRILQAEPIEGVVTDLDLLRVYLTDKGKEVKANE